MLPSFERPTLPQFRSVRLEPFEGCTKTFNPLFDFRRCHHSRFQYKGSNPSQIQRRHGSEQLRLDERKRLVCPGELENRPRPNLVLQMKRAVSVSSASELLNVFERLPRQGKRPDLTELARASLEFAKHTLDIY